MNQYLKSYAIFVAFMVATKLIVKPVAAQLKVPFLSDL